MNCSYKGGCSKKAITRYSPDIDIQGVGACKEHRVHVHFDLLMKLDKSFYELFEKKPKRKKK